MLCMFRKANEDYLKISCKRKIFIKEPKPGRLPISVSDLVDPYWVKKKNNNN